MTTDTSQPQLEQGPVPDNSQGPSQGHRRRRRRRKNKSSQQSAPQAQPQQQQAPAQPVQRRAAPARQNQGRKKKFFQKGSAPAAQPGNNLSSPPPARHKGRQKGPREFVGPMDHSYRAVNGNIADGPASTIQIMQNNRGGSYYPEAYAPEPPASIRADAPTRIYCFIADLFFQAKIHETARKLGVKVEFLKGDKESIAKLTEVPEAERPALLVFDLNNLNAKPMTLIPKLKTKFKKATSIVGFLNHLQGDLKLKATEVGCDTVMPRSAFSQSLPNLLRRYGIEEEEEEFAEQPV
jgi:hypothetical protein